MAGECGAPRWGRPPRGLTSISLWGKGSTELRSMLPLGPGAHGLDKPVSLHPHPARGRQAQPPTTLNPQGHGGCSRHRFRPGPGTSSSRVKFPGYSVAKTTAPREPHLLPQLAGDDGSPTRAR